MESPQLAAVPSPRVAPHRRILLWDSLNSSSAILARTFRALGWEIEWLLHHGSPNEAAPREGESREAFGRTERMRIASALAASSAYAVTLHGDDQVRLVLEHWDSLPTLHRHLPSRDALEVALSKEESMQHAKRLGIPVLETEVCETPQEVAKASARLAPGGHVVLKGEGGSAGSTVRSLPAGVVPPPEVWHAVTARQVRALVQRRITGPRVLVTVVFERGRERASVVHEKVLDWPPPFGITAAGITRRIPEAHAHAERLLQELAWHGFANVELRRDDADGRWYFMEVNPRVPSSVGIQAAAGLDLARVWADVCLGERTEAPPDRSYREGVGYVWTVPAFALAFRNPLAIPAWVAARLARGYGDDLRGESRAMRRSALRLAAWKARYRAP